MLLDFPVIGDIVISPNSKVKDEKGNDKYDLLECDGGVFNAEDHPLLSTIEGIESGNTIGFTGLSFPIEDAIDITWYDSHYWVLHSDNQVTQYDNLGVPTGTSHTLQNPSIGICYGNGNLWAQRSNGYIEKYSLAWDYISSTSNAGYPCNAICYNGDSIAGIDGSFLRYFSVTTGAYTGALNTDMQPTTSSIEWFGDRYVNSEPGISTEIKTFGIDGIFIETLTTVNADQSQGIAYNGSDLLLASDTTAYEYTASIIYTLPNLAPKDALVPYKIVADYTGA